MNTLDKKYYKIRDVAEMIGVPCSTLRFWEKEFSDLRPKRNDGGTRFYTPRDVEIVRMIHYLVKEKGLKIDAARDQLHRNRSGVEKRHADDSYQYSKLWTADGDRCRHGFTARSISRLPPGGPARRSTVKPIPSKSRRTHPLAQ